MELNELEYLNLFKQVKDKDIKTVNQNFEYQMLKETPDYSNFNQQNEVYRHNYSQDLNLNEFNIETRINGQNVNEIKRQEKENKLNEIMELRRQERLNEIKKIQEEQSLNEKVNWNSDVVTLEMFNKARYNSMMQVAKILPK